MPAKQSGEVAKAEPVDDVGYHERMALLLECVRNGDRAAFEVMVRELTPMLWQVARSQGLDRDSSADVVQTTWLELLGSLNKIHTPAALAGWLVTVTKRESWRVRRIGMAERPAKETVFARITDPDPVPDDYALEQDHRKRLWAAVDELPERCRTLLRVIAFTSRPDYIAVGTALGMPIGSIGPTRGRCLAKLRALLKSDSSGGWR
jgi:RNA polymerase sigma factor (sigma-70 family)